MLIMTILVTATLNPPMFIEFAELSDVYIYSPELANNSEHPVMFPLYGTSVFRELKEKNLRENYFFKIWNVCKIDI